MRRLIHRLLWAVVTLFGAACITYIITYLVPADPARAMAGPNARPETVKAIRHELGLDKPLPVQFARYITRAVRGDWGRSYQTGQEVLPALLKRFPATAALGAGGLAVMMLIALPLGLLTASRHGSRFDQATLVVGLVVLSVPIFWLARVMQFRLSYQGGLLPVSGWGGLRHLVLPSLTLGLGLGFYYARLLHTSLVEELGKEYIQAARARGLSETSVLIRHALRNALIPVVTMLGLDVALLLSGAVFTETVFGIPGLGQQVIVAVFQLDVPMILGTVLFSAVLVVSANLVVDLLYPLIDPRVQFH